MDDGIVLNEKTHILTVDGKEVYLAPIQWRILALLISNPGHVYTYRHMGEVAWQHREGGYQPETSIRDRLTWHISRIKLKLGRWGSCIELVFGFGYKFNPRGLADSNDNWKD